MVYNLLCNNLGRDAADCLYAHGRECCNDVSHITREIQGIYISPDNIANIDAIFRDVSLPDVNLIV